MSSWQQLGLAGRTGSGRFSVDQLNSGYSFRDSYQLSKKYPSAKVLQDELETCKEQLGQWELRAVAAEAEVTSLGFQKVTMEQEITKYQEEIKWLNEQLDAERERCRKQSKEVLHKITHVKDKMDELRKSEKEARDSLDRVHFSIKQFKSGVISQESFFSQVETLFATVDNKKILSKNGKKYCDERVHPTLPVLPQCSLDENNHPCKETILEDTEEPAINLPSPEKTQTISPSPPPIPPKGVEQEDESPSSEPKKPIPPPRKLLPRTRQISSPGSLGSSAPTESSSVPSKVPPPRRRLSSRVDSLYSLAPPPGTPVVKSPPLEAFVFGPNKLPWSPPSSESEDSDFESFTPPLKSKLKKPSDIKESRPDSPLKKLYDSFVNSKKKSSVKNIAKVESSPDVALTKKGSLSNLEPAASLGSPKQEEDEESQAIKKSSPIMTKRPVWFKRDSVTSTKSTTDAPGGERTLKRRSRSMDANMHRSVSSPVNQFRDQPVALSDGEDSTGGSCGYTKPFQHVRKIQQLLNSRQTVSSDSMDQLFNDPSNWHRYDDDSEEDMYYINPEDIGARKRLPESSFKDSPGLRDNTYLMLSDPQLDYPPRRRIGISIHSPSPNPGHADSPIYCLAKDICEISPDPTKSGLSSDATSESGNEVDSEDNIYENPDDDDRVSPLFDNHMYLSRSVPVNYQDEIYAQIDEVTDSYSPVSYSSSGPSSGVERLKQAFIPPGDGDMQKEDGYARVCDVQHARVRDIQHSLGIVHEQAPLLPPRPPNFMRVKSSNPTRTVPGIGSLPRYTTLGGSEHQVQLVPLNQTSSWRHTEPLNDSPLVSSSLPNNTFRSPSPPTSTRHGNVQPKKSLQHSTGRPDLHRGGSQLTDRPVLELPSNKSAFLRTSQPRSSTLPSAVLNSAKKISCNSPSSTQVHLEKSGYLAFHELKQKGKRKWVVLSGTEVKLYASQKNYSRKKPPQYAINLDKCTRSSVKNGTEIQLVMSNKVYCLAAADKSECEAWLRVIEAAMQGVSVVSNSSDEDPHIPALSGWAGVKGISKPVWCFLEGHTLLLSPEPGAEPTQRLDIEKCSVKCKKDSILVDSSHTNLKAMVLTIRNKETKEVTTLQPTKDNVIEEWCYVLNSLRCGEEGPELTRTEQFLSEIMKENPISHCDHPKWNNPIFKVAAMPIRDSLISMPTVELKKHAKGLFRDLQKFLNKTIDSSNMEFQMSLAQMLVGQCLTHSKLQDEIYCQLLRQMSGHTTPTATPVLQGWLLLFLLIPMYLPSRKIVSWYLTTFLERFVSSKSPVICELAKNCQNRVKLCSTAGSRQCTPTFFELKALFEEFVASPRTPPTGAMKTGVYLSDSSVHEAVFFATTTVSELMSQLAEKVGLPDSASTGFALMCDWPGVTDEILCCPFLESKVCDVISMWTLSMEDLNQHTQMMNLEQRNITFTYKRRLAFKKRLGSESSYECVLLAHQISKDVLTGVYPMPSKEAAQLAAIMAQLEYGDIESLPEGESSRERLAREAVERFCPWNLTYMALEHVRLQLLGDLKEKWWELAGKSRDECAQLYLSSVQVWPMCGATVFEAKQQASLAAPHQSVWLAIHENGVSLRNMKSMETIKSYSYNDISTFGGHGEDDFMLVVTPKDSPTEGTTEKLLLSMDKIHICEATFLMATYIECLKKLNEA